MWGSRRIGGRRLVFVGLVALGLLAGGCDKLKPKDDAKAKIIKAFQVALGQYGGGNLKPEDIKVLESKDGVMTWECVDTIKVESSDSAEHLIRLKWTGTFDGKTVDAHTEERPDGFDGPMIFRTQVVD